jgi:hypothetical protein
MDKPTASPPAINFTALVEALIDPSHDPIAERAVGLLVPLSMHLAAIIGQNGFHAIYERSLHEASKQHPWLMAGRISAQGPSDFEGLKAALYERDVHEASHAAAALLSALLELLASLIGHALTMNLLRASWDVDFENAARGTRK